MPSDFEFNTGRGYSPQGQIIQVRVRGNLIYFYDTTRFILGVVESISYLPDRHSIQEYIMRNYDFNTHRCITLTQWEKLDER